MATTLNEAIGLLIRRQDGGEAVSCAIGNEFNGGMGLRIASVFVIMFSSSFGTSWNCPFPLAA
jgi:hypothetical protein